MQNEAITLKDLFVDNDPKTNKRALNCKSFKVRYSKKNPDRYIFLVKCKESYSSSKGHLVSFLFHKDEKNKYPLDADVNIRCSCPAWTYWGSDYQSSTQGYWLDFKELRYPIIRDPNLEHRICKHTARVRLDLRNKTYRMLDRQKKLIEASENFPEVNIEGCYEAIEQFFTSRNLNGCFKFISNLTEDNFEKELLRVGLIV